MKWIVTYEEYDRYELAKIDAYEVEKETEDELLQSIIEKHCLGDEEFTGDEAKNAIESNNGDGTDCISSIVDLTNQKLIFTFNQGWI